MFDETHILHTTIRLTIGLGLGFFVFRQQLGMGLIFGGLMGSLAFKLMIIDATRLLQTAVNLEFSRKQVSRYNRKSFLKRYALYAATLIAAILSPYLSFLAALVGLLLPRVAIIYLMFRRRIIRGT